MPLFLYEDIYYFFLLSLNKSTTTGDAINIEEYVPTNTPTISENTNPIKFSPPNKNIIINTNNVVKDVFMVLLIVEFIDLFDNSINLSLFNPNLFVVFSLILSNIITVSFKEYPITVNIAAIKGLVYF